MLVRGLLFCLDIFFGFDRFDRLKSGIIRSVFQGMIGIDGESAHLQKVRAQLCVGLDLSGSRNNKKTTIAKSFSAADELKAFASDLIFGSTQQAYALA